MQLLFQCIKAQRLQSLGGSMVPMVLQCSTLCRNITLRQTSLIHTGRHRILCWICSGGVCETNGRVKAFDDRICRRVLRLREHYSCERRQAVRILSPHPKSSTKHSVNAIQGLSRHPLSRLHLRICLCAVLHQVGTAMGQLGTLKSLRSLHSHISGSSL